MKRKQISIKAFMGGVAILGMSLSANAQVSLDGSTANTGSGATASGNSAVASGDGSVALGVSSDATGLRSIAIGDNCNSTGLASIAMGFSSQATGGAAVGIGTYAVSSGSGAFSLGGYVNASGSNSMAFGQFLKAQLSGSMVIGTGVSSGNKLINNTSNSLMVGFGSNIPTLFVSEASSSTGTGEVRIGGFSASSMFNGQGKLQVIDNSSDWNAFIFNGGGSGKGLRIKGGFYNGTQPLLRVEANNSSGSSLAEGMVRFSVLADGRVVIGDPEIATEGSALGTEINRDDYRLFVQEGILAEKVKVAVANSSDWADYVFEENYELKALTEVESFINENNHLPDVPSAQQVAKEGIDVAKMDALLLQKIEELTLYVIDLEKKVKALETK